ncbi:hypothetical protein ACF08M_13380 [Streptomyces sp. NPDC015032]|uniref:hypothetical protein n=1 Tax=Streptomyces sp. NPDC015032 TaxID=3364937 RepID=UPI0036FC4918
MDDEIMTTVGRECYSFDGRILEIFGRDHTIRFHIRHMYVRVTGPDRRGKRVVEIGHGRPEYSGGCHIWRYTAAEWEQARGLAALLEAVQAAIDSAPGHGPV